MPAFEVHVAHAGSVLAARIDAPGAALTSQYAFYLHRNGQRVENRRYSSNARATFNVPPDGARYRAVGFVRNGVDGVPAMAASNTVVARAKSGSGEFLRRLGVNHVGLEGIGAALDIERATRLDVSVGSFDYACLVTPRKGKRLFVILGGAAPDRAIAPIPRFNRFSWAAEFPGTLMCVADPTLTLDPQIQLGWYVGRDDNDAMPGLAAVVRSVAQSLGVAPDQVCCYGSSGGGFAALQLAARLGQGATAIAINAQTDAMRFGLEASVDKFLSVCMPGLSRAQASRQYPQRLSALAAWAEPSAATARCLLVQNTLDRHHYTRHFLPFLKRFDVSPDGNSADGRIGAMTYADAAGHVAEPRSMLSALLERAEALRAPSAQRLPYRTSKITAPKNTAMNVISQVAAIKPAADFLNHTYISLRHAYMYAAVGKAANSTVKHHLYELEYAGTRFKTKSLHDRQSSPLLSPFQLPDDLMEQVFTSPKYFRFSMVRNPYTRILSCYLDRIVPANSAPYRQLMLVMGRPAGELITFAEFVRAICAQKPFNQNNHWRLQVAEICQAQVRYDFVGKQETFAQDMTHIWSKVAGNRPAPDFAAENKAPSITSAEKRLEEFYTPELVDLVRSAYGADFKAFGYSTELM